MSHVKLPVEPTPALTETTEKVAPPPEYPWQPRIPEWAEKAQISSHISLRKLPTGYGLTTAEINIGHGRPLILIHKNMRKRSHLETYYCATIKDTITEHEYNVPWSEIEPWTN